MNFTWGDTVMIRADAPPNLYPGAIASVCGIREVETLDQERRFGSPIGTQIYLIELQDGTSIEISEKWLETASGG